MEKLVLLRTAEEIRTLTAYLKDKTYIAFDTETTGVTSDSKIIGLCFCAENDLAYYIISAYWDKDAQTLNFYDTRKEITELCQTLNEKDLIMHNGTFDCMMVENNYKISLINSLHTDTMIMAHILDENRPVGLKDLAFNRYGADAKHEQNEMKASVLANGGQLTKANYELYKADAELIGKYGAKDAILTWNLFWAMVPELFEEGLDKFFYEDESMPLLRGPTYDLNSTGLKVDVEELITLKKQLEVEILDLKETIDREIAPHIKEQYPGTNKRNTFNIGSREQLAWLLFHKLGNTFVKVSKLGQDLSRALKMKTPYSLTAKKEFLDTVKSQEGAMWRDGVSEIDKNTGKMKTKAKIGSYWKYLSTDKAVLNKFSKKYLWVEKILEHKKLTKLLGTYVEGIQAATSYGVIKPSFLQHGTTSGRYSSRSPNFQNLPRDDKRVKSCIVSRPGKVFVGADYSQLEPRIFASFSDDERLIKCFEEGDDFYSVIGVEVFEKYGLSLKKDDSDSFAKKHPDLRNVSKTIALSATYGTTAPKMAPAIDKTIEEAQNVLDNYFHKFPSVLSFMLQCHETAKKKGRVENLYGRPRRMPEAKKIAEMYKNMKHSDLPYTARNLLNLSVNHRIQSTAASIMNRAAIRFKTLCKDNNVQAKIVLQIHDELVVECGEKDAERVKLILKDAMENTVELPRVQLIAEPKIAENLADLK